MDLTYSNYILIPKVEKVEEMPPANYIVTLKAFKFNFRYLFYQQYLTGPLKRFFTKSGNLLLVVHFLRHARQSKLIKEFESMNIYVHLFYL